MDEPEAYQLPNAANAVLPSRNNERGLPRHAGHRGVVAVVGGLIALRRRREPVAGTRRSRRPQPRAEPSTEPEVAA